jgi:hypothetical protein
MSISKHRWIIDDVEEGIASVEVDGDALHHFPLWLFPTEANAGDIFAVTHRREGERSALEIVADVEAREEALRRSRAQRSQLARSDPGGDIAL